jgi:hypothetical protein
VIDIPKLKELRERVTAAKWQVRDVSTALNRTLMQPDSGCLARSRTLDRPAVYRRGAAREGVLDEHGKCVFQTRRTVEIAIHICHTFRLASDVFATPKEGLPRG